MNKGVAESACEDDEGRGVVVRRSGVASLGTPPSRCALIEREERKTMICQPDPGTACATNATGEIKATAKSARMRQVERMGQRANEKE